MAVTDSLTTRDRQLAAWVADNSQFEKPYVLIAGLRRASKSSGLHVRPQTALALCSKEGGRNIFGGDYGSGAAGAPPWYHERVTEARYRALRRLGKPNGVGHTQLTSFFLCDKADRRGGAWLPYYNIWTGVEYMALLIHEHGYENGANRYNGGDSLEGQHAGAAAGYGSEFVTFRQSWERKLKAAGFDV